jgi:hypothetical protein
VPVVPQCRIAEDCIIKIVFYVAIGCIFLIGAFVDIFMHGLFANLRTELFAYLIIKYTFTPTLSRITCRVSSVVLAAVFFHNRDSLNFNTDSMALR